MTSRELEYIKTVADEKSISSAARKLYIAQPSLSQSLQRIEENLGAKLFNRTPSGLTLTYAGERCYQMACQVLKIYSDFEAEISDINQLKTGRIVMGTTNHLGTVILPEILLEFKENSPSVELEILEDNTGNLEAKLLTGAMDFALLHAPKLAANPLLNYEFLSEDPFVIALAAGHPLIEKAQKKPGYLFPVLDVRLLKNEPLILLHPQQRIRHVSDAILAKAKITPNIVLTIKNYETAQRLAGQGIGITFLPMDYAALTYADHPPVLLSIDESYSPSWDLSIATLKGGFLSRADQYFLELVRQTFAQEPNDK